MKFEHLNLDFISQQVDRGDLRVIDYVYDTFRSDFLGWAHRRFPAVNQEDLLDVWQDTIIMFYEQVRDQKLREMNCSLKTFLFLIGHRRLLKHFRKASRIEYVTEFDVNKCAVENIHPLEPENHVDASLELLLTAIDELPEKTRQILSGQEKWEKHVCMKWATGWGCIIPFRIAVRE